MARFYTQLNESLRQFIAAQRIFFNASAPNRGRINVSPMGLDTFRVLSDRCVGYLDLTGSECETAAHLAQNARLTLMFCSFQDKPLILRLYGRGRVVRPHDPAWPELRAAWEAAAQASLETAAGSRPPRSFTAVPEQYLILVTCRDEQHQVELLSRFQADGLPCRALLS
jgi:hypothetical protein